MAGRSKIRVGPIIYGVVMGALLIGATFFGYMGTIEGSDLAEQNKLNCVGAYPDSIDFVEESSGLFAASSNMITCVDSYGKPLGVVKETQGVGYFGFGMLCLLLFLMTIILYGMDMIVRRD